MQPTAANRESDVRLPRQVRERMERIRLMTEPEHPPAVPSQALVPDVPPAPPGADPQKTPSPPAIAADADKRHESLDYWKQRFQVTDGMLKKAKEQHQAAIEELHLSISQLRSELANKATTPTKKLAETFFTPEQIEQFGEDQCEAIAHAAVKAAQTQIDTVVATQVKPLEERLQRQDERRAQSKKEGFADRLAEIQPDYQIIDADTRWLEWLAEEDPRVGLVRQIMLNAHLHKEDAHGVARMMKEWKASIAPPAPPVAPSGQLGGGLDAAPPPPPATAYPSQAEIREFYKRKKLGKVSDKEAAAFEVRLKAGPVMA